ncbi:MAG: crotonyl-CoA carboxylase/reductase [Alphaproteobacteria bacterium]|nr:crotonyl-CoA carboxylase/reductase [Alphaproteobacteria bacterium]
MKPSFLHLGEPITIGQVPQDMLALTLCADRYGEPSKSMKIEKVDVPSELNDYEILIYVMAAGVNHNAIWAGRAKPIDVLKNTQRLDRDTRSYFIPGSDGAGIVWRVGPNVTNVKVGDEVILQSGYLGPERIIRNSREPLPNIRAWGYEVNGGTFAQFTRVQSYQCIPKPKHLSWAEASCFMVSAGTAYRMLCHWTPNEIKADEPILIWGGASGLGCMAIQICNMVGAKPVVVVSSPEKKEYCKKIGAVGVIERTAFHGWGKMPDIEDRERFEQWRKHVKAFRNAFYEALGERRNPTVVLEHPGESTFATSLAVVERGGMVVTCGGTSGYYGNFDLRQLWVNQKRIQGSHFTTREQCIEITKLVSDRKLNPCLSKVYSFEEAVLVHQLMADNRHPPGNISILINAKEES